MLTDKDVVVVKALRAAGFGTKGRPKRTRGCEGSGLVVDVTLNGVVVGEVADFGDGGGTHWRWRGDARAAYEAAIADPTVRAAITADYGNGPNVCDEHSASAWLNYADAREMVRTKLVAFDAATFEQTAQIITIKGTDAGARAAMLRKYPTHTILNDVVASIEASK